MNTPWRKENEESVRKIKKGIVTFPRKQIILSLEKIGTNEFRGPQGGHGGE